MDEKIKIPGILFSILHHLTKTSDIAIHGISNSKMLFFPAFWINPDSKSPGKNFYDCISIHGC